MIPMRQLFEEKNIQIIGKILLILMILIGFSFFSSYFDFDEAGQFWISKGLNHESAPFSETGGLSDVIINNHDYNLDPGGFSILLHFWSMVSDNYIWLRILPYFFFVLTIYFCYKFVNLKMENKVYVVTFCFLFFFLPHIWGAGLRLRAYSMEILGIVISLYNLQKMEMSFKTRTLMVTSLSLCFFMTSRYSFNIVAFTVSLCVLLLIIKQQFSWSKKILLYAGYSLPLLITLGFIYFFSLSYQNSNVGEVSYLQYLSNDFTILLAPVSLFYFLIIGLECYLYFKLKSHAQNSSIFFVTIVTNILFLLLSSFGLHPWDVLSSRCISMLTLTYLCLVLFVFEFLEIKFSSHRVPQIVFTLFFIISVLKICFLFKLDRQNTLTDIQTLNIENKRIFIDRWENPTMRYQFEYGELRGLKNYPNNIFFLSKGNHRISDTKLPLNEWYQTQPGFNELSNYDILIAPELFSYRSDEQKQSIWKCINKYNRVFIKSENQHN